MTSPGYPPPPPPTTPGYPPPPPPPPPAPPASPGYPPPPPSAAPQWPYQPPVSAATPQRVFVGSVIALVSAALAAACTFLPWLQIATSGHEQLTGWQIYERAADVGENPILITEFFSSDFSPFFTGLATVIAAAVLGAAALLVLMGPKTPQPARFPVPGWVRVTAAIAPVIAVIPGITNLASTTMVQAHPYLFLLQPALVLIPVFTIAGWVGLAVAAGGAAARR
jgi:hypothetical protein